MFMDVSRYSFLERITDGATLVGEELARAFASQPSLREVLGAGMAMDFPSNQWTWDNGINTAAIGYDLRDGNYSMLTLFKPGHGLAEVEAAFPETLKLLAAVPGLHYAALSAMGPRAHLGLHTHSRRHFIYHLLLNDLTGEGCVMTCGDHARTLKSKGDTVLFDYSLPHESRSLADNTRINLMIDFLP